MRAWASVAAGVVLAAVTIAAAEQTWTGQISDSLCKMKHEEAAEGQGKMPDDECTRACIKGGSTYVFIVDKKVYQIENQTNPDLDKHAGHTVKLTGEMKGDSMTVTKIAMP